MNQYRLILLTLRGCNIMQNIVNQDNPQEILSVIAATHYCWTTQLTISGPESLAIGAAGTFTVTAKDWQGNSLSTFTDNITINAVGDTGTQEINVAMTNGTGTFEFTPLIAGTYALSGIGQTKNNISYDSLPTGGLNVVAS